MIKLKDIKLKSLYDLTTDNTYAVDLGELKKGEKIPIVSDTMLKAMFLNNNRIKYSAKFFSYFLDLSYEEILKNIHLSNNELDKKKEKDKGLRCDYVGVIDGTQLNIEVNTNSNKKYLERNMNYAQLLYSRYVKRKTDYNYSSVYQFNINNFAFKGNDKIIDIYTLRNEEGLVLNDKLVFIQIYVPNLRKKCYNQGIESLEEREKYILTLVERDIKKSKEIGKGIKIMEEYIKEAEEVSNEEDIGESYSLEESLMEVGIEKGIKEGKQEGIKEGAYNQSISIAKSMLKEKIDINTISKCTGLTIEDINALK